MDNEGSLSYQAGSTINWCYLRRKEDIDTNEKLITIVHHENLALMITEVRVLD